MMEYWGVDIRTDEDIIIIGYNLDEACKAFNIEREYFKVQGWGYIS